ncbi:MAG: ABC transporter transmembrane domain-containing protein [Caldilineaceae bacterium]
MQLNILAAILLGVPVLSGLIGVAHRYINARIGESVIYDLRQELYNHLQRMSLRFFTNTKSGEIISRLNNDVVGAQNAITGTIPNIATNAITLISTGDHDHLRVAVDAALGDRAAALHTACPPCGAHFARIYGAAPWSTTPT